MTESILPCPFCGHDPMRVLVIGMRDTIKCANVSCPLFTVYLYPGDWNTRAQPASEPKPVESAEPVAWMDPRSPEMHATISNEVKKHNLKAGGAPTGAVNGYSVPLFTRPAPAGVVLPERYDEAQYRGTSLLAVRKWNACLDAVIKLNGAQDTSKPQSKAERLAQLEAERDALLAGQGDDL